MDIVDDRSPFRLKETYLEKSSGGWIDLAQDIDAIVLFGSGFEDIIKAKEESTAGLCHIWKTVPKGKDYLTVSVPLINQLYERAGSKLTRKYLTSTHLQWHRGGQLWEPCRSSRPFSCTCIRLQQVVSESCTRFGSVLDPGALEENGAVIFGQANDPVASTLSDLLISKAKPIDSLYSQPNANLLCADIYSSSSSVGSTSTDTRNSSILHVSVSTLETSDEDEDDQLSNIPIFVKPIAPGIVKLVEDEEQRGRSRSLKRSYSEKGSQSTLEPHRRRRNPTKEIEVQCSGAHAPTLFVRSDGDSITSLVKKNIEDSRKLALRRGGNFSTKNDGNDGIRSGGNNPAIRTI